MDSPDLQSKYQKLATEYSKLRAQNQVLKKAIIEEQSKTYHLKDSLKSRDQSLRKAEQENDSLNFRNQQLTKRLTLLQDDLEQIQNKPRKGQVRQENQSNSGSLDQNVYAEELQLKIKENARLHAELADNELFFKNKILELEIKLEESNRKSGDNAESMKIHEEMLQREIKKLEMERTMQDLNAQHRETEIVALNEKVKSLNVTENRCTLSENRMEISAESYQSNLSLVDLNLESPVTKFEVVHDSQLIKEFVEPIKQLSDGFYNYFHSYVNLLKNSSSMSLMQSKLVSQISDDCKVWETMASLYSEIASQLEHNEDLTLESLKDLESFSRSISNCSVLLRKMLPIMSEKISLKEENEGFSWRSSWGSFVACWAALSPYISSLAAHSEGRTVLTSCALGKIFSLLSNRLNKLHLASKELLNLWQDYTFHGKDYNEVSQSLHSISDSLNKISTLFSEKLVTSSSDISSNSSTPSTISPDTPQTSHHLGLSFLSSPDGNGWSIGIQDGLHLVDSEASLAQQLAHSTSRLSKLEEEKEYWRLEFQLLNHRYEKECQKSQLIEDKLKHISPSCGQSPKAKIMNHEKINSNTASSLVSEVTGSMGSAEDREKEIRNHFTNRCSHLYMQLAACASQAALYQNECETLIRRMTLYEEAKSISEQDVEHQRKELAQLQENLSTTSRNYEEQISTMSDHLADLNEKITSQADFIEQLKFEIKKKGKK